MMILCPKSNPRSTIKAQYHVQQVTSFPDMSALCLSHILRGLMEIWRKKWQESNTPQQSELSKSWQLTVMEPEDDFFFLLPDGDDFVAKSSDEAVLDEPV